MIRLQLLIFKILNITKFSIVIFFLNSNTMYSNILKNHYTNIFLLYSKQKKNIMINLLCKI